MYDNYAGIQKGGTVATAVRFAQSVSLKIQLTSSGLSQIYPPLLTIKYSGRLTTSAQQSSNPNLDSANAFATSTSSSLMIPTISFTATYIKDMSITWIIMIVFTCVFAGVAFCAAFVKVWIYQKQRRNMVIDLKVLLRLFIYTWIIWSDLNFIVIYGVAAYCYLFYKYPTSVFALLPNQMLDQLYFGLQLGFTLLGKAIDIAFTLYKHCSHELFFIDFEKSRGTLVSNRGRPGSTVKISIWRTIQVAKEWKRLQQHTIIRMPQTILFLLFLLYGCNAIYLATEQPSPTYLSSQDGTNAVLRFAIVSTLWISIALAQYLYYRLFHFRFVKNPLWLFVDLCSLSNISLLLLSEDCFGYYIHGQSPHPHADADFRELYEYLKNEKENKVRNRGLVDNTIGNPGDPCQTFEVHLLPATRQTYNEKLNLPIAEDKMKKNLKKGDLNVASPDNIASPELEKRPFQQQLPAEVNTLRLHDLFSGALTRKKRKLHSLALYEAYQNLNDWLEHMIQNLKRTQIMDKMTTNRLGFPPDLLTEDRFLNDPGFGFQKIMMMGCELQFMAFYILLFGVLDIGINNSFITLLIIFIVYLVIMWLRSFFVDRNIANKTLIDERFLLT